MSKHQRLTLRDSFAFTMGYIAISLTELLGMLFTQNHA